MFKNIYKNRKVLVSGHTGFKGTWLALWLKSLGANVIGYSLEPPTDPGMFEVLQMDKKIIHCLGDIRDYKKLKKVFEKYQPEIVFHLAAQAIVIKSYKEPKATLETNIMGTVNILEATRFAKRVRAVINVTSDKCYENKEWVHGYREIDPMGGHDPYSSSKGCSELITAAYRSSFFRPDERGKTHNVGLASARAGNVIGGGDWAEDRLIPDCIRAFNKNKTLKLRSPESIRPWQHVLEPLSGYLWLGAALLAGPINYGEAWNFGPRDEDVLSVEEVVKETIKIWGKGEYQIKEGELHEAQLLKLDIGKSMHKLLWKPVYTSSKAIRETINWYKEYYGSGKKDMYAYSLSQIKKYQHEAKRKGLRWAGAEK